MGKRVRKSVENKIPVDSFSDIAFLLIIFFILVTSLVKTKGILTELPQSEKSQQQEQDNKSPTVRLNAGQMYFNDTPVSMEQLKIELQKLELADKKDDAKIVLFEPDDGCSWQDYFATMATISAAGGVTAIIKEDDKE